MAETRWPGEQRKTCTQFGGSSGFGDKNDYVVLDGSRLDNLLTA